ncbi:hypothetical protein [Paenimyroides aestuarii]|uniref:LAGLIDADG homing endonuclease n=1 Tax=Paenimyroides aestuarii TaxID=2968490 RepID=A0ABY5NQK8_9FLAO|nr:hypothetical protein [Paenimyroides aestuarii]UUV20779.1 hypothetical protein NPX36_10675 [Paenimyroides aestuarii]
MSYLRNIILEEKDKLPKEVSKTVNQFYNKIKSDSYYPDNKNVIKLKPFSTIEVNNFLLDCLAEYDKTERLYIEHHDIVGLRGVWTVLSFSKEENTLKYFDGLIDKYISGKPFYLHFLFELFGYSDVQNPLYDKIKKYYDRIFDNLPAYQLLKNIGVEPQNKYDWSISFKLTTDGEWFTPNNLSDEQKEKRFSFDMRLGQPQTMGDTYNIDIQNDLSQKRKRITFSESRILEINVDKTVFKNPDLLNLNEFINKVEQYFEIKFNFEKIANLSVSKGIKKQQVEKWIKNEFKN